MNPLMALGEGGYKYSEWRLGQRGCRTGPEMGWADRPGPVSAQFSLGFLPGSFPRDSPFVCTCMWAFDVVSFVVKA
jgi:hypothetical protein